MTTETTPTVERDVVERLNEASHDKSSSSFTNGCPGCGVHAVLMMEAADEIERLRSTSQARCPEGQFLLDRLDEHEFSDCGDAFMRDWWGHVQPAIERFRSVLSASPTPPSPLAMTNTAEISDCASPPVATDGMRTQQILDDAATAIKIHDGVLALKDENRRLRDALYQFEYPPDARTLREIADEVDCGSDCERGHTEWDTGAHVCSREDKDEGCAAMKAWSLRQLADAIETRAALPAVAVATDGMRSALDQTNNAALLDLSKAWKLNGDCMQCRACNRALIASRDGEPLHHRADCQNSAHVHPWAELRAAITTGAVDG